MIARSEAWRTGEDKEDTCLRKKARMGRDDVNSEAKAFWWQLDRNSGSMGKFTISYRNYHNSVLGRFITSKVLRTTTLNNLLVMMP